MKIILTLKKGVWVDPLYWETLTYKDVEKVQGLAKKGVRKNEHT